MIQETKRYSNWIKANNIKVVYNGFYYNNEFYLLFRQSNGWWATYPNGTQGEVCLTKTSCIYFTIKSIKY